MRYHFPVNNPPSRFPMDIVIAIEQDQDILAHVGSLQRASAEEPVHACLLAVHRDITSGASNDIMNRWKTMLLSVPLVFAIITPGEQRYWKSQQLREDVVESFTTLKRSDLQKIYDVVRFKQVLESDSGESLSAEKLSQRYHKNVKFSAGSDVLSKSFIDSAITIKKRLLSKPSVSNILLRLESSYLKGNPLGSIWKLQALLDCAKTDDNISDALDGLLDHFRMQFIDASDFALPKFKDRHRSYIEVVLMKRDLIQTLSTNFLNSHNFKSYVKDKFRDTFATAAKVRDVLTPYPDSARPVDTTWQAAWPYSGVKLFDFAEACPA